MPPTTRLEAVLARDRALISGGVLAVAALAWAYMVWGMAGQDMGAGMAMPVAQPWSGLDFTLMFVMWAVMMVAMMVPTVTPMVLAFAMVNRKRRQQQGIFTRTGVFVLGYLLVWWSFALLATVAQWRLHQAALLPSMMGSVTPILGGAILVATGVFQWTRLKDVCLRHCRTPLSFFMTEWREGNQGALIMGFRHGAFCLGCCWFLMGLMFVGGVMNLLWMAAITVYVLLEKVAAGGHVVSRVAGALFIAWGLWLIAQPLGLG